MQIGTNVEDGLSVEAASQEGPVKSALSDAVIPLAETLSLSASTIEMIRRVICQYMPMQDKACEAIVVQTSPDQELRAVDLALTNPESKRVSRIRVDITIVEGGIHLKGEAFEKSVQMDGKEIQPKRFEVIRADVGSAIRYMQALMEYQQGRRAVVSSDDFSNEEKLV